MQQTVETLSITGELIQLMSSDIYINQEKKVFIFASIQKKQQALPILYLFSSKPQYEITIVVIPSTKFDTQTFIVCLSLSIHHSKTLY